MNTKNYAVQVVSNAPNKPQLLTSLGIFDNFEKAAKAAEKMENRLHDQYADYVATMNQHVNAVRLETVSHQRPDITAQTVRTAAPVQPVNVPMGYAKWREETLHGLRYEACSID